VGLPGGKKEDSDPTYLYTAIRETLEEIGVDESTHHLEVSLCAHYICAQRVCVQLFAHRGRP